MTVLFAKRLFKLAYVNDINFGTTCTSKAVGDATFARASNTLSFVRNTFVAVRAYGIYCVVSLGNIESMTIVTYLLSGITLV